LGSSQPQIRLDYKPENKSVLRRARPPAHWLASALALPVIGGIVALMGGTTGQSSTQHAPVLASLTPQTRVLELPPLSDFRASVADAAPAADDTTTLRLQIARGDTLDQLFRKNGLSVTQLQEMLALPAAKASLRLVKPGDVLAIRTDAEGIVELTRRVDEAHTLTIERQGTGFAAHTVEDVLEHRVTQAHAVIDSSLFNAGKKAGVSDRIVLELAGIFAWDIDFVLDIREGDDFTVVYEQVFRDGEYLRDGEIVAAEFTNAGDTFRALRFAAEGAEDASYYTPDGLPLRKAFLRAPLEFTRISSEFNPRRRHPILNTIRAHKGVDYAAPAGTPVKAAGDGKVLLAGRKGGYGNCIVLQHGGNVTTLYGHLSRFASNVRNGTRVRQGQTIGFVGMTGLATAPHLHYEYRIAEVHQNPRTVKLPQADPIAPAEKPAFLAQAAPLLERLALVRATQVAQIDPGS
jgi:murein DD-endopeptidase MepM/ murein hydrolase activator NlpD